MRVLVVLAQPPLAEGSAQGRCAVGLLRGLLSHGVEVRALAARWRPGDPVASDLPVDVVDVGPRHGLRAKVHNVRYPRGRLAWGSFGDRVRDLARGVDVVHLEEAATGWCAAGLTTPTVTHFHYLTHLDRDLPRPWDDGFLIALEHARADRLLWRRNARLLASSPVVADELRRVAPRAEVFETRLSLDPSGYAAAELDGPPVAGLIGTAQWPPTRNAIERLVGRVWPRVRERVPEAVLRIAGRGTDRLELGGPGVELLGEVPVSADFLRSLSVLVYPPTRGSGTKVKVLEAIACGVPVVTTACGAEGVEAGDGVVVEADDDALAAATTAILRDPAERHRRGQAARQAFMDAYTPSAATAALVDVYRTILAGAAADGRARATRR